MRLTSHHNIEHRTSHHKQKREDCFSAHNPTRTKSCSDRQRSASPSKNKGKELKPFFFEFIIMYQHYQVKPHSLQHGDSKRMFSPKDVIGSEGSLGNIAPDLLSISSLDSFSSSDESALFSTGQRTPPRMSAFSHESSPQQATMTTTLTVLPGRFTAIRKIRVPRSTNPHGADAVLPEKKTLKKQRKRRMAAGTVGGMVVGGLVLGPGGVFVGAAVGGVAANKICKTRERRAQRKYEQENFQSAASRSLVHHGLLV